MIKNGMNPHHPGEFLEEEFLKPMGLKATQLAHAILVAPNRMTRLCRGEVDVTPDTAERLGLFFNTTAQFWLNLQMEYDARIAEEELPKKVRRSIERNRDLLLSVSGGRDEGGTFDSGHA